jgi:FkbM family methyltransferase
MSERSGGVDLGRAARRLSPRRLRGELASWRVRRRLAGPKLIRAFADTYPEAVFVEIGANDGVQHDHLRPLILSGRWSGVMVEPVPYVFERLRGNYGGMERVRLENAAVADRDGARPFYHLAEAAKEERARLPEWYDGIGSFSREAVLGHGDLVPDIERRLMEREVQTLTLESLCRKHGLHEVDLVLVDAEGYDAEIIRAIDFDLQRPRLLIYEHYHLSHADRAASRARLEALGYELLEEHFDSFCLDVRIDDRLTDAWRELRPGLPGVSVHDERPA